MSWEVRYTAEAKQDLRGIYEYIAFELCVPETASKQVDGIMKQIRSLENMPLRYKLYEDEPWFGKGLRFFSVGNYLVFYLPSESEHVVKVVRIMYKGRDIRKQLKN